MTRIWTGIASRVAAAAGAAALSLWALPMEAQEATQGPAQSGLRAQPSTRGRTTVTLVRGQGGGPPARIIIDYGQPHARGRKVIGSAMVPFEAVWRTGANEATSLVTDVDLLIGGAVVPKGSYTLYTRPSRGGWKLIINKNTGQWGTNYAEEHDLARVDLRSRELRDPVDSFSIWLVPDVEWSAEGGIRAGLPRGVLRLAWGEVELTTDWSVR